MIGRDDLLVVRSQAGVRPSPGTATLVGRLVWTFRGHRPCPHGCAPHFNFDFRVKTSPQPSTICNSQPLPVPKFQIRLHKKDDDKAGKQGRVNQTANL
jgi:hypothetical protein